jgi:hypothetical protein
MYETPTYVLMIVVVVSYMCSSHHLSCMILGDESAAVDADADEVGSIDVASKCVIQWIALRHVRLCVDRQVLTSCRCATLLRRRMEALLLALWNPCAVFVLSVVAADLAQEKLLRIGSHLAVLFLCHRALQRSARRDVMLRYRMLH